MAKKKKRTTKKGTARRAVTPSKAPAKRYADAAKRTKEAPLGSSIWTPEEDGDWIGGKVITASESAGKWGPQTSLILDADHLPQPTKVYFSTVLARIFYEQKITIGSDLVITYRGNAESAKRGRPAKLFVVEVIEAGSGGIIIPDEPETRASKKASKKKASKKGGKK